MSVVVNMACGLANRMFQYSFYLYLKSLGYNVEVDYCRTAKLKHERVLWEQIFPEAHLPQAKYATILKLGGGKDVISKVVRKYFPRITSVKQMNSAFDVVIPAANETDVYMIGVFQNAAMVSSVVEVVRSKFKFEDFQDSKNASLYNDIAASQSVAIHVRKADDYTSNYWFQDTCPLSYYKNAIEYICSQIPNPKFFVFADNPQWVKNNFDWFDYTLVDHNPSFGWGNHFDMQLMSACKHNVISNSTYAWWAAFINSNANKKVILPEVWFNPNSGVECSSKRLCCEGWIAI